MQVWKSLINPDLVASSQISFQELHVDGETVFWTESRPLEKGRHALMKKVGQAPATELFPSMSIQSKVHEYGGGAFFVAQGLLVFFDHLSSSLYMQKDDEPLVLLAQDSKKRWADFSISTDLKSLVCVCEDHAQEKEVHNYLVLFDLTKKSSSILHKEYDFYASPQWSPNGEMIGFIHWDISCMPWEESFLKIIASENGKEIASIGGAKESISQYIWTQNQEVLFVSDRNGFANLYLWSPAGETLFLEKEADFAPPLWILGRKNIRSVSLEGKEHWIVNLCEKGIDSLGIIDKESRTLRKLDLPYTVVRALDVGSKGAYFIAGAPDLPLSLIFLSFKTYQTQIVCQGAEISDALKTCISLPKEVSTCSSLDGHKVFGFLYLPKNPSYKLSSPPPLLIKCHSGPTAHAQPLLHWEVQFWTSRGFAYLDVNYRGSSGFGRRYREDLNYHWGIVDVQDCLDLAEELGRSGIIDGKAIFAKGSSAGGFTALCMAAVSPILKGCVSYYGVTDLLLLTQETHKFERPYLDFLVGRIEEFPLHYTARSPNQRSEQITCPVLFFHGDRDFVVPLTQAEELHKKLPSSQLIRFEGEGHGFRRAETIKACLEAESNFYTKLLMENDRERI